jgi:hypothetical protein
MPLEVVAVAVVQEHTGAEQAALKCAVRLIQQQAVLVVLAAEHYRATIELTITKPTVMTELGTQVLVVAVVPAFLGIQLVDTGALAALE